MTMFRRKPRSRTWTQEAVDVVTAVAYECGYLDGEDGTPLLRGQLHVRPELVALLPDEELDVRVERATRAHALPAT